MLNKIGLNHVFVVVSDEDYERIVFDKKLKQFAFVEEKKVKADEGEWTGFYIFGKNTYLEIFSPQPRYPEVGQWGIGLGADEKGLLTSLLGEQKGDLIKEGLFKRDGREWFQYLYAKNPIFHEGCYLWLMEYVYEPDGISRRDYNRGRYDETKEFLDIESFTVTLEEEGFVALRNRLKDFGFSPSIEKEDELVFSLKNFVFKVLKGDKKNFSFQFSSKEGDRSFDFGNLLSP